MLFVREHVVLLGQVRPGRVDDVNARESILHGDFLSSKVLLNCYGEVGTSFIREVV